MLVSRERCRLDALRAVLANSGCANAATGRRGLDDAAKTQGAAALAVGRRSGRGRARLDRRRSATTCPSTPMLKGILRRARAAARATATRDFQQAIQTTDAFEKRASLEVELPSGTVRLSAQCKGAGMISPRFATMLCFVETDAALAPETADLLLGVCVKRSFDRVSVDGQLSTNDTAILMCSGASGVRIAPESEDELRFGEALDALLRQLAIMMVADGEGAGRIARVLVRGGDPDGVEAAARAVANSPLVKTALHGGDPNWGRIVQAVGGALRAATRAARASTSRSRASRCARPAPRSPTTRPRSRARCRREEVEYEIALPGEGAETEVFFSDLSHEYVTHQRGLHDMSRARPTAGDAMRDVGTLLEALPYIREFHGKTVVIKYGGAAMEDPDLREEFARDVVLLKYVGLNPIVVHGGGPEITAYMERLGPARSSSSAACACPTRSTVEVAKMVLVGKVNKEIVLRLNRHGQPAVGPVRRRRLAVSRRPPRRARAARTSASSGASSASTSA